LTNLKLPKSTVNHKNYHKLQLDDPNLRMFQERLIGGRNAVRLKIELGAQT